MKLRLIITIALLFALQTVAAAQEKEDDKKTVAAAQDKKDDKKKDEPKTHTVKAGFFEVIEEVNATVESKNMTEVLAKVDNWSDLEIQKIIDEGATVNAGDEIVWFKTEDIDRKLKDTEYALQIAELTLKSSELDLDLTQNTFDLDMLLNERKQKHLEEDFKYFSEVERPNRERSTQRSVQNSQHALEYAQEEYGQLKRMYDEDELTEESEEIVLKRTQRDVENRQFYLEQAQIRASRTLETDLPREADQKKAELDRARLEHQKSKIALPMERDKKRVAYEKARVAFANEKAELDELRKDRERMTITSPSAGVLYFGRCVRGKWMGPAGPNRDLRPGKKAPPNKIIVTIVDPAQVMLRADLSEKLLSAIRAGSEGVVTPTAFPNSRTRARVAKVAYVPVKADTFDCQMDLTEIPAGLMPGMTCKVRFLLMQKDNAISVPTSAVFTNDGVNHYVYKVEGDGHKQVPVTVALESGKNIEVTAGLSAGDEILTERPE